MRPSSNPFMNRINKRGQTGSGRTSEARVAKSLHARLTANSGATQKDKGDMKMGKSGGNVPAFLIEAKSTKAMRLAVEYGWLTKIMTEANNTQRTPALAMSFTDDTGKARAYGDWVAVPRHIFAEMVSALECKDEE